MSKELENLRSKRSEYIKKLGYTSGLGMVSLLKECYYGSLYQQFKDSGHVVGNFLFKVIVNNGSVEVEIRIRHPDDFRKSLCIQHFTLSSNGNYTYHTQSLSGKWDTHLAVAVESIREGQLFYLRNKLSNVEAELRDLITELDKEKSEFEKLFD